MNALDICNGCEVNEADPDSVAGYCSECEAEARKRSVDRVEEHDRRVRHQRHLAALAIDWRDLADELAGALRGEGDDGTGVCTLNGNSHRVLARYEEAVRAWEADK